MLDLDVIVIMDILKWLSKSRFLLLFILFLISCFFYYGLGDKVMSASIMLGIGFLLLVAKYDNLE